MSPPRQAGGGGRNSILIWSRRGSLSIQWLLVDWFSHSSFSRQGHTHTHTKRIPKYIHIFPITFHSYQEDTHETQRHTHSRANKIQFDFCIKHSIRRSLQERKLPMSNRFRASNTLKRKRHSYTSAVKEIFLNTKWRKIDSRLAGSYSKKERETK